MKKKIIRGEVDPDEWMDYNMPGMLGDITQLTVENKRKKVKRRPIGFTADIDEFIEE